MIPSRFYPKENFNMNFPRFLPAALALLAGMSLAPSAHAADKDSAPKPAAGDEKALLVKFERYGGFAGFHDNLSIFEDFSYELGTPPHIKHVFRGKLTAAQADQLAELLKGFGKYLKEHSDGPKVADGMRTRLEIHGKSADPEAKGDETAMNRLLHQVTTAARRGERSPK